MGNDGRVAGRVALVTGAAAGIGRATAIRLAADGATVAVVDVDADGATDTVAAITAAGGAASVHVTDIADPAQRDAVVDAVVAAHGRLDVLVNNAAITGTRTPFLEVDDAEWRAVIDTNLTATAFLSQAAARHMISRGSGSIVNVSSIQRRMPVPTYATYVASKGGIAALTRALAVELSPLGVRVNAIDVGVVATASFRDTLAAAGQLQSGELPPAPTLLGRSGHPDEIAGFVAFLSSDDASYLTGAILTVDGGRTLSRRPDAFDTGFRDHALPGRS